VVPRTLHPVRHDHRGDFDHFGSLFPLYHTPQPRQHSIYGSILVSCHGPAAADLRSVPRGLLDASRACTRVFNTARSRGRCVCAYERERERERDRETERQRVNVCVCACVCVCVRERIYIYIYIHTYIYTYTYIYIYIFILYSYIYSYTYSIYIYIYIYIVVELEDHMTFPCDMVLCSGAVVVNEASCCLSFSMYKSLILILALLNFLFR